MVKVAGQVRVQPVITERSRLATSDVGHGDEDDAAGPEKPGGLADRLARFGQVFERVPEDDCRVGAFKRGKFGLFDFGMAGLPVDSRHLPAARREGVDQCAFAGTDVEDRPRRSHFVDTGRHRSPGAAEQGVTDEAEAVAGLRPVPVTVGLVEGGGVGPGVRRSGATFRAAGSPVTPGSTFVQSRSAPRALRGRSPAPAGAQAFFPRHTAIRSRAESRFSPDR